MSSENYRFVPSEIPVKEGWSRLGYFDSKHNAKEFLKTKSKKLQACNSISIVMHILHTFEKLQSLRSSAHKSFQI